MKSEKAREYLQDNRLYGYSDELLPIIDYEDAIKAVEVAEQELRERHEMEMLALAESEQHENKMLRERIPQWHDLRKNPEDLPAVGVRVLIKIGDDVLMRTYNDSDMDDYYIYLIAYLEQDDNGDLLFRSLMNNPCTGLSLSDEVIAWCEIPKFE